MAVQAHASDPCTARHRHPDTHSQTGTDAGSHRHKRSLKAHGIGSSHGAASSLIIPNRVAGYPRSEDHPRGASSHSSTLPPYANSASRGRRTLTRTLLGCSDARAPDRRGSFRGRLPQGAAMPLHDSNRNASSGRQREALRACLQIEHRHTSAAAEDGECNMRSTTVHPTLTYNGQHATHYARQHGQPDAELLRSIMRHGRQRAHVADASRPHQPSASVALLSGARHNSGNTAVAVRDLPPPPPPPPRRRVGSAAGRRGTNIGVAAGADRAVRLGLACAGRRPIASRLIGSVALSLSAVSVGLPCARA